MRIPAGVTDGRRIRLRGRGGAGAAGGPPGDLYVIVRVGEHPLFGREGDDLTLTVPVSFTEAALGARIEVPTFEGEPGHAAPPRRNPLGPDAARARPRRAGRGPHGRPARYRGGGGAGEAERRAAAGAEGLRRGHQGRQPPRSPGRSLVSTAGTTAERYAAVRGLTEQLAAPLSAEDQCIQTMDDVSPTKWHRAHTTWFFETFLLKPHLDGYREVDPLYGYLFNSYYEAVGRRHPRPHRGMISRPSTAQVTDYRAHVDEAMARLLAGAMPTPVEDLVELGLNHEQQHQELLLMDIKHVLGCNPAQPAYRPDRGRPAPPDAAAGAGWTRFEGGRCALGHDGASFAFDNETPRHEVILGPYELSRRPATCGGLAGVHGRRRLPHADAVAVRRLGGGPVLRLVGAPVLAARRGWRRGGCRRGRRRRRRCLDAVHPGGTAARAPRRAGVPRLVLRGRRLRPLGRRPPADRGRVGGRRGRIAARRGEPAGLRRAAPAADRRERGRRSSSATSGNGRRAPTARTRASFPRPGPSASTTASS